MLDHKVTLHEIWKAEIKQEQLYSQSWRRVPGIPAVYGCVVCMLTHLTEGWQQPIITSIPPAPAKSHPSLSLRLRPGMCAAVLKEDHRFLLLNW